MVRAIDAKTLDTPATRLELSPEENTPLAKVDSMTVVTHAHTIYPDTAMTLRLDAELWVEALVGVDGTVRMARILKGDIGEKTVRLGFERSGLTADMQTTYKPALRGNNPIEAWVAYKIAFLLQ